VSALSLWKDQTLQTPPLSSDGKEEEKSFICTYYILIIFYFYNAPIYHIQGFLKNFCDAAKMAIIHKKI
jgi:hypothetical protein